MRRDTRIRLAGSLVAWLVGATIATLVILYASRITQTAVLSAAIVYVLDDLWRVWWRTRRNRRYLDEQFTAADTKAYLEGITRRNVN